MPMPIISVRLSDDEYASLKKRAGKGRGALSHYLRQRIQEPSPVTCEIAVAAPATTTGQSVIQWMTGHVGPNLNLRTL
jgi:hypothetical protein